MKEAAPTPAPRPGFELEFRVPWPRFPDERYVVRVDGVPHAVLKYYRPGRLWLVALDESKFRDLDPEEMTGWDTNEFPVRDYTGGKGALITREGVLVKPEWAGELGRWTADDLYDEDPDRGMS